MAIDSSTFRGKIGIVMSASDPERILKENRQGFKMTGKLSWAAPDMHRTLELIACDRKQER